MRRRDKSDMTDTDVYESVYMLDDLVELEAFLDREITADLVILAIDALEVAMGEEYVAYSGVSAEDRLLAVVKANGADRVSLAASAIPSISDFSGGTARAGAKCTG
jgi:hypothetical protein